MNTISITTTQNIDVEYELGSLGDRVLGRILDGIILAAFYLIIIFSIGFSNVGSFLGDHPWLIVLLIIPYVVYDLASEALMNGQSAGKKIMGIRVINLSGEQPTLSQYLIRWLFRAVDFSFTGSVLALILVAATEKKQRLGDIVAGTVLIKTKPAINVSQTIYQPIETSNYQVIYPEVVNLSDSDVQLIKDVVLTVRHNGNTMIALQAMQKVEQTLHIMNRHANPMQFLEAVLADYNHLTSQV